MHPKMNDAYLKTIFYWIRHNLTYIGNRRNYSDYAGIMPASSLAALLSLNESASTIKCIAKQTRTVTNYRKESESRGHFVTALSVCKHWSSILLRTVPGGGERPALPGYLHSQETKSSLSTRPLWKDRIPSYCNPGSSSPITMFHRILGLDWDPSGRDRSSSLAGTVLHWVCLPSFCF